MRKVHPLLVLIACLTTPLCAQNQPKQQLTPAGLPDFLTNYQKVLDQVDAAYNDMGNYKLPLRDENGQPLGRHHINDRRKELATLRETARQLASKPDNLVLTTRLFIQTEALVDDLFDLSQISYDNDREELGKRFADLEMAVDRERGLIEAYALSLAEDKQKRLERLEKKTPQPKAKPGTDQQKSKRSPKPSTSKSPKR